MKKEIDVILSWGKTWRSNIAIVYTASCFQQPRVSLPAGRSNKNEWIVYYQILLSYRDITVTKECIMKPNLIPLKGKKKWKSLIDNSWTSTFMKVKDKIFSSAISRQSFPVRRPLRSMWPQWRHRLSCGYIKVTWILSRLRLLHIPQRLNMVTSLILCGYKFSWKQLGQISSNNPCDNLIQYRRRKQSL